MYLIFIYVPETHVEQVKEAMFKAGAGRVGNYSCCSWQVKGEGQFFAKEGSHPYLGTVGAIEKVSEHKVSMICTFELVREVLVAMRAIHPYETPAYGVLKLEDF